MLAHCTTHAHAAGRPLVFARASKRERDGKNGKYANSHFSPPFFFTFCSIFFSRRQNQASVVSSKHMCEQPHVCREKKLVEKMRKLKRKNRKKEEGILESSESKPAKKAELFIQRSTSSSSSRSWVCRNLREKGTSHI